MPLRHTYSSFLGQRRRTEVSRRQTWRETREVGYQEILRAVLLGMLHEQLLYRFAQDKKTGRLVRLADPMPPDYDRALYNAAQCKLRFRRSLHAAPRRDQLSPIAP